MWRLRIGEEAGGEPWLRTTNAHAGRQVWEFDPAAGGGALDDVDDARREYSSRRHQLKHSADRLMRLQFAELTAPKLDIPGIKLQEHEDVTKEAVLTSLKRAIGQLSTLQAHDGHWPGDIAGPMFLLPGLVIALHSTGALNTVLSSKHQREIRRYLYNHQNKDGGWGLHIEGPSTMFGSVLNYVTLRLLEEGSDSEDGAIQLAQNWILDHGGATFTTSWGKFWLSVRRFLVYLTGLVTIHCFQNYGYYHTASHFIQGACGPIAEWYTFPCLTYMERGLSAQLHQLY
uniref:Squalene cyclase N-terminal domain-containing protein n=1 Tax=Triticum urartu TaxID=4572 RepID=A0A8R7URY6_TRIUA